MTSSSRPLYEKLLAGGVPTPPTKPPRASASVIPWRQGANGVEVYWVRRSPELAFMGGWHAFPGGGMSRRDAGVHVAGEPGGQAPDGWTAPLPGLDESAREQLGPDLPPGILACALRELFEEIGILPVTSESDLPAEDVLAGAQQSLLNKDKDFATVLADLDLVPNAGDLVFAGRWMTPPLAPMRFDNRFFLLEWSPERQLQPQVIPGELADGEWIAPSAALARWKAAEVITAPPILHLLRVLAEDGPIDGLSRLVDPEEADIGPMRRIEFRPGVILLPLRTATLPPATHTNSYLFGREEVVLVDPAPDDPAEIDVLRQAVAAAQSQGRRVRAIWLTHHHADHIGAVAALREMLNVPVLAHEKTAARLQAFGLSMDGELQDDERVVLGEDFAVRVLHTPGHTRGHLAFYDETHGSLLIGDLIAGIGTIVVDPPEGDMDEYLASLERMIELAPRTLFPGHGPAQLQAVAKLTEYRDHRLWREARILKAYRGGAKTPAEILPLAYDDVPPQVHPIAERQLLAHLERLRHHGDLEEGR